MKLVRRNISILHGELVGIIGSLVLLDTRDSSTVIYMDHLNSTRLIDDSRTSVSIDACLRHMNSRAYYRWILHLLGSRQVAVLYTKGHSAESSIPSILNSSANHYASKSQHILRSLPHAPLPTFFMDRFTFFTSSDSWIESNIRSFTDQLLLARCSYELERKHGLRLIQFLYDPLPHPTFIYVPFSAIRHLSSCTRIQDNFPQQLVSTPDTGSYPNTVALAALTLPRTITTSLLNAHISQNCALIVFPKLLRSRKPSVGIWWKSVCYPLT
jgi:hypothetical protein